MKTFIASSDFIFESSHNALWLASCQSSVFLFLWKYLSTLLYVSQAENLNVKGRNVASLATTTFEDRQHFKSGRQTEQL